ncbi:hypothetical protein KR084_006168 [Drosophila pseudotakahashii]|nr:hypothetical protein KR084_006168 [Drosophila pseudotakahashii]
MDELLLALCNLANTKHARVVIKESSKGGAIVGASALAVTSGFLLGPVGLALGVIIGGVTAFASTRNKCKQISAFIMEDLSKEERQKLKDHMIKVVEKYSINKEYRRFFLTNPKMQRAVLKAVKEFFKNDLGLEVVY